MITPFWDGGFIASSKMWGGNEAFIQLKEIFMNHNKLKCYGLLLDAARIVPSILNRLPRGNAYIEDQLKRALSSAILNLSEGNGRRSIKDRNRFFDISLASISETSSAIDIISAYGYISSTLEEEIKSPLTRAYAMIIRLRK